MAGCSPWAPVLPGYSSHLLLNRFRLDKECGLSALSPNQRTKSNWLQKEAQQTEQPLSDFASHTFRAENVRALPGVPADLATAFLCGCADIVHPSVLNNPVKYRQAGKE